MQDQGISRRKFLIAVTAGLAAPIAMEGLEQAPAGAQPAPTAPSGPIQLALSGTRTQFTTSEPVELAILYTGSARTLPLQLRHSDGSLLTLQVPFPAGGGPQARMLALEPGILKPGDYTATAREPGSPPAAPVTFGVHQADHPNAYFIGAWMQGNADPPTALAKGGWMYFSSDLVNASVRKPAPGDIMERYIAARMKPFSMTVMGGGHQMDLNLVNDWSDPWVQRSTFWKMGLAALSNRLYPSAGLHAFDEPGLTWWSFTGPDGKVIGSNPYAIPVHLQDFKKLTGKDLPDGPFEQVGSQYKEMMDSFIQFIGLRLTYLEQAWWAAVSAVDEVHAPFITINQVASSYAPGDITDGVDNRMDRPYRVLSGHGGYSDWAGSWGAVISGRSYDGWSWDRPHYYLPMWGTFDYARMRQEVFLPWSLKLEGIEYDPNHNWSLAGGYIDTNAVFEVADVNRRLALVGDIMNRMPRTLAPVALLISHSQFAYDVATANSPTPQPGAGGPYVSPHRSQVDMTMRRVMSTGLVPNWIDEYEVSEKGADFLKQWKVVYCPGLAVAEPSFRKALEGFIAGGGKFIQGKEDKLQFPGAVLVDYQYKGANPPPTEGVLFNDYTLRKYSMDLVPTFAADLTGWLGERPYSSSAPLNTMLFNVQQAGEAVYLLMANNSQDPENTRHTQMDPIPLDTTIHIPAGGIVYDLFNGGTVPVEGGQAALRLAGGDGACWLHLPSPPGPVKLSARAVEGRALQIDVAWGRAGYLPFRLRILDPAGSMVDELFRATTPPGSIPLSTGAPENSSLTDDSHTSIHPHTRTPTRSTSSFFTYLYPLGANAAPGTWTVEVYEWLTGSVTSARVSLKSSSRERAASLNTGNVSIYLEDARKIQALFAGKPLKPPFEKMHWDCKRVFALQEKRFAIFGSDNAANQVASALKAKGMNVEVNPQYEIVPFQREPGHGGTGPIQDQWQANFENIYSHTIVLPGHPLGKNSWDRGHINRPVTDTFPGPGRAYIQWGMGGYQAGFENIWIFGDTAAGVEWLLAAMDGQDLSAKTALTAEVKPVLAAKPTLPSRFTVEQEIKLPDTPVGIGASPDGNVIYVLLGGGSLTAYDMEGEALWSNHSLLQGGNLAVSPKGDRIAIAGFPGLLVLDATDGKILGGYRAAPLSEDQSWGSSRMITAAWNSAGTIAAGGGISQASTSTKGALPPVFHLAIADSQGKPLTVPEGIIGDVMGMAFVPQSDSLLIGANQLTAVNAADGSILWRTDIGGAQSFAFSPDGKTGAAGGWGKRAGIFSLADGKLSQSANFDSNIGGVALLPKGDLAVAVWGGTHPLYRLHPGEAKPAPLFQGRFGFQDLLWSGAQAGLVAAEQGGRLWLLGPDGAPRALLEDAGTTPYRMQLHGPTLLLARMNRVVQQIRVE